MSSKKNKSDLLVKTRYLNPIPPPACPAQTIEIPTDLGRMGKADLTSAYAASLPMPMMIDSEIGMPLDLNACGGLWWNEVDSDFNPQNPVPIESLHPDDAELLDAPNMTLGASGSGTQHQLPGTAGRPRIKVEETWLRGTTYMGRTDSARAQNMPIKVADVELVDVPDASMHAQLIAIEKTFWQHQQFNDDNIKNIRHPTKKGVTAVDALDLLPDEDIWGGQFSQVAFPERPTDKEGNKITNEQLLAAVVRPRSDPLLGFQAYMPNEEDLPQWVKLRHHLLTPEEAERDPEETPWEVVTLPLVQTFEITERWAGTGDVQGPCTSVVLTFSDGNKLTQQDEILEKMASSGNSQDTSAAVAPKQEAEDDDEDDDDIFGDKELEQEEEAQASQAKQEEVAELSTRVKAKGRGVYYVPMVSDNKVKRLRATGTRHYQHLEDHWDGIGLAFQHPSSGQTSRREANAKLLDPEWEQDALHQGMPAQEREGEAMGEADRV